MLFGLRNPFSIFYIHKQLQTYKNFVVSE